MYFMERRSVCLNAAGECCEDGRYSVGLVFPGGASLGRATSASLRDGYKQKRRTFVRRFFEACAYF